MTAERKLAQDIEDIIRRRTDGGGGAGIATEDIMDLLNDQLVITPSTPDVPDHSPVVLAHVIAEAVREIAENSHQHRWDILGVSAPPVNQKIHPRMAQAMATTLVLLRCQECSFPVTAELDGTWTEEQIKAKLDEPIND